MRPTTILSRWLFDNLAGTFVEESTLYVGRAEADMGVLNLSAGEVQDGELHISGYAIKDGQIYPLATKKDIKGAFVVYDNIEVMYGQTKDGPYAEQLTCRILCVDKTFHGVESLADAVEEKLSGAYIQELQGFVDILSRKAGYDPNTGEFLNELKLKVDL